MIRKLAVRNAVLATIVAILCAGIMSLLPLKTDTALAASCDNEKTFLGINPWYHDLCDSSHKNVEIGQGPDGLTTDVWHIVLNTISIGIVLAGYVAVGLVIWGGIKYMLARGDSSNVTAAKTTIQNALIGLLITLSANAIVTFIAARLG